MSGNPADEHEAILSETNGMVREYGSTGSPLGTSSQPLVNSTSINRLSQADLIWILGGLYSAMFLAGLDMTIVATLVTPIGSYFEKSHQASYLGTSYLLSVCCFTPLYGRLSDIMGRKGAMLLALSFFGTGTLLCGMATSMEFLIIARAIAGMGGGGILTVSSISVTDIIPLKERGLYQGISNILFGLGSGIGGPFGGWVNDTYGWRAAFLTQVPILVLSATVVLFKVNIKRPDTDQTTRQKLARIDYGGSFTLVIAVGSLLFSLSLITGEDLDWSNPIVIGLLCLSGAFTVAFVFVEGKWAPEPVMPLRLLTMRTPLFVALFNLFASWNTFATLYNVPLYFSAVRLNSASEAGLHLLPNAIAGPCGSLFAGWMIRKTGKLYWLMLGSATSVLLSAALIACWNDFTHKWHLWFDIVFGGFGRGCLTTTTLIALIGSVDRKDSAVATGISYLFRTTGQVFGVSLSGALVQSILVSSLRERMQGPDTEKIIQSIRHSTSIIPELDPTLRQIAIQSYKRALTAVFISQLVLACLVLLSCIPIEENPLPGSHEEQERQDRLRRERERIAA